MAEIIIMPKLGYTMNEGKLIKWYKAVGETVTAGENLFELNTDKTVISVEAAVNGILLKILIDEDTEVPVFTPIAVIGQEGDDPDETLAEYKSKNSVNEPQEKEIKKIEAAPVPADVQKEGNFKGLKITPRAKKYAGENNINLKQLANLKGTGFDGGITEKDIRISPLGRKLSEMLGVDVSQTVGTGSNGKVTRADVERDAALLSMNEGKKVLKVIPYKGTRKIIGDRLAQSKFTAPHLYFTDSVDMSEMIEFRKTLNGNEGIQVGINDILIIAVKNALVKYPEINASFIGEEIVQYESINIGLAVAGDNGLIVPAVRDVQHKTISQISDETTDLVGRAREGRLTVDEYTKGTFTISNLGMFGIENFTAIINPPESAILSVSSVRKRPVVITNEYGEDEIAIRPIMNIQLTVDHRIIDGLLASQFVEFIKAQLENPITVLL